MPGAADADAARATLLSAAAKERYGRRSSVAPGKMSARKALCEVRKQADAHKVLRARCAMRRAMRAHQEAPGSAVAAA